MLKEIGLRVKKARNAKNMSQAQLAGALHVSVPYISHIELGKQAMSVITLSRLCAELDVSADWLLNGIEGQIAGHDETMKGLLSDCTPAERTAIIKVIAVMKASIHEAYSKHDEYRNG